MKVLQPGILLSIVGILFLTEGAFAAPPAAASGGGAASKDQIRRVVDILRRMAVRNQQLENKVEQLEGKVANVQSGSGPSDGTVDLSKLGGAPAQSSSGMGHHGSVNAGSAPVFKAIFDFNIVSKPGDPNYGKGNEFTFSNTHRYLFFENIPIPEIQFSFEVSTDPKYYELDYQLSQRFQFRFGKIWIPFDDLSPHNIFGGRVNVSDLAPAASSNTGSQTVSQRFLPDIWAELGIGAKYQLVDTKKMAAVMHLYIVNGFASGGTDPVTGSPAAGYPQFGGNSTLARDNNKAKSIGSRLHLLFFGRIGIGASFYTGRWNDQDEPTSKGLTMVGLDNQIRLGPAEYRFGLTGGKVALNNGTRLTRGGFYGEAAFKFGSKREWKFLTRAGAVQFDDRARDVTDQTIVGATILYKPSIVEFSLHHSIDLNKAVPTKVNFSYTALRAVVAL